MTDAERKALVERLRDGVLYGDARLHNPKGHDPLRMEAADQIEADGKRIAELEEENEGLKKAIKVQASAVRTLQVNEATEINILRQQKREWHQAVSSLDSEREANAILTAEIEKLREALRQIARLRTDLSGDFSLGSHQSDIARAALEDKA